MDPAAENFTHSTAFSTSTSSLRSNNFLTPSQIRIETADTDIETRADTVAHAALEPPVTYQPPPAALPGRVTRAEAVRAFKTEIGDAKEQSAEEIKNITTINIKKVAYVILGVLAATLAIAGVAATCVFCPPVGVAILAIGLTVLAAGGVGAAVYLWPDSTPADQVEGMKQNGRNLDKALELFEQYPKTETSDGNSFEEFLENECPVPTYDENLQGPLYTLQDLDKYTSLFEKKRLVNDKEKEIADLHDNSHLLEEELTGLSQEIEVLKLEKDMLGNDEDSTARFQDLSNQIYAKEVMLERKTGEREPLETNLTRLEDELPGLERDYQTSKDNLVIHLAASSAPPYRGQDTRTNDPRLNVWLRTTLETPETDIEINRNGRSIYTFGELAEKKYHGIHVPGDDNFPGHALRLSKQDYTALGRSVNNNFLSNSYVKEITIEGKAYKSVTHYMLLRKFDSLTQEEQPRHQRLKDAIEEAPTAEQALHLTHGMWNPNDLFTGMDRDLKKALFYKFVAPNGELTKEGRELLATGDKTLYAGHERGDPSYGVQFINRDRMKGQNKLGVYLTEIRSQLADQEQRRAAARAGLENEDEFFDDQGEFFDAQGEFFDHENE